MKHSRTIRLLALAVTALTLPGCLAVNMLLGAGSLLVGGPVEYASIAYTVSEYTYQYAVNDKNPGEVIEDKIAWIIAEPPQPSPVQLAANIPEMPTSHLPTARLKMPPVRPASLAAHPTQLASTNVRQKHAVEQSLPKPDQRVSKPINHKRTIAPAPIAKEAPTTKTVHLASHKKPVQTPHAKTLLERQRDFASLDRHLLIAQEALRITLPESKRGINGAWQIRHRIDDQPYSG